MECNGGVGTKIRTKGPLGRPPLASLVLIPSHLEIYGRLECLDGYDNFVISTRSIIRSSIRNGGDRT